MALPSVISLVDPTRISILGRRGIEETSSANKEKYRAPRSQFKTSMFISRSSSNCRRIDSNFKIRLPVSNVVLDAYILQTGMFERARSNGIERCHKLYDFDRSLRRRETLRDVFYLFFQSSLFCYRSTRVAKCNAASRA